MPNRIPKHIVRLLLLLSCFSLLAFAAKVYLTDPSYYKYGYYRADAVPELAAGTPQYQGSAHCLTCHEERSADWSTAVHKAVQCEVCHGISQECPVKEGSRIPADKIRLCSTCHEAMPARPASQPQIVFAEHPFPDEEKPQCKTCHNPHSPTVVELLAESLSTDVQADGKAEAAAHIPEAASKCLKCHGQQGQGRRKNPPIAGLDSAVFIEMMNQFKSGAAESKTMIRYAKSLSDEEIAELARYYEGLPAPPAETPPE